MGEAGKSAVEDGMWRTRCRGFFLAWINGEGIKVFKLLSHRSDSTVGKEEGFGREDGKVWVVEEYGKENVS